MNFPCLLNSLFRTYHRGMSAVDYYLSALDVFLNCVVGSKLIKRLRGRPLLRSLMSLIADRLSKNSNTNLTANFLLRIESYFNGYLNLDRVTTK